MGLKAELKEYARSIGLAELRVTSAAPLVELKEFLMHLEEQNLLAKFVNRDFELITSPKKVLAGAKSVIVCALSYYLEEEEEQPALGGKVARFARIKDYHLVLGQKLEQLENFLRNNYADLEVQSFVDTGPTVDRALARRAGIGWQGKNCSIIHPEYGSWIVLGGLITNLELEIDQPLEERCGDCERCLQACPTGALRAPYILDASKCLGYITLSKGQVAEEYRPLLGDRLWGCDTCQEVCSHNQEVQEDRARDFEYLPAYLEAEKILELGNQDFKKEFGTSALNWRGKRPLKRNAALVLGNLKQVEALPALIEALEDPQAVVRAHVAWALGELGVSEVVQHLKQRLVVERAEEVQEELKKSIKKLSKSKV